MYETSHRLSEVERINQIQLVFDRQLAVTENDNLSKTYSCRDIRQVLHDILMAL